MGVADIKWQCWCYLNEMWRNEKLTMSFVIDFQPVGKRKQYRKPVTILEAAREAGIHLKSVCGGQGECGKCRVRVRGGTVSPLTDT